EGSFVALKMPVMRPASFVAFRLFILTVGQWRVAARWLKNLLVRVLIHRRQPQPIRLRRIIRFAPDEVVVEDELKTSGPSDVSGLMWSDRFVSIQMGSSRYFVDHELIEGHPATEPVDHAKLEGGIQLRRAVGIGAGETSTQRAFTTRSVEQPAG